MGKIKVKRISIYKFPISLYFFIAPFSISIIFQEIIPNVPTTVIIMMTTSLFFIFYFLKVRTFRISSFEKITLLLFIYPVFLSFIGIFVAMLLNGDQYYLQYLSKDFPSRMILIILNLTIIFGLLSLTVNWPYNKIIDLIKMYYYGLLIIVLIGVWQFLHFVIDVPFLDINTRNHIHSVSKGDFVVDNRLTSIANEPSYLAPIAIDLIIIAFIVSKHPLMVTSLGLFVLIFSYSGGGYLNILFVICAFVVGYFKYKGYQLKGKYIIGYVISFSLIIFILINYLDQVLNLLYPVLGRLDTIFSFNEHSRMFMILMPLVWVFNNGLINAIVGFGPGSFKYLSFTESLPNGLPVHGTSNNLFADTIFELGYIGFLSYSLVFIRFILKAFGNLYNNRYYFISFILTVHLLTSSIYRADFMQPRFWIILYIIMILFRLGYKNKEVISN